MKSWTLAGWRWLLPENIPEAKVLVVDDETNIVELLSVSLKFQGFEVHTASNGPAALDKAREIRPDAVILDVMMPGMDGFGLLRRLRADGRFAGAVPHRPRHPAGQDRRPDPRRRRLRHQAVFPGRGGCQAAGDPAARGPWRRGTARGSGFADIELDEDTHEVWKAGQPVSLSPTEFTLLRYFIINAGTVLSKPKILDHVAI